MDESTDTVARIIAIAGLAIAVLKLVFDIAKERARGRRINLRLIERELDGVQHLVVEASIVGDVPVSIDAWGLRVVSRLKRPQQIVQHTTGIGERLPTRLEPGDPAKQFALRWDTFHGAARDKFPRAKTVSVRGFVLFPEGRRRWSGKLSVKLGDG